MKPILITSTSENSVALSSKDFSSDAISYRFAIIKKDQDSTYYSNNLIILSSLESWTIGLTKAAFKRLNLSLDTPSEVDCRIEIRDRPESFNYIKKKMTSKDYQYTKPEIDSIVRDLISGRLSDLEKSSLV